MDVFSADWLGICRRAVAAQRRIFDEVRGSAARTVYEGIGEGGDRTLVIDRRCEDAVFAELEALAAEGAAFVAVSEERGEVAFGSGGDVRVVIDPIDGSLNARRTIPSHSLSVAVASGPSMADVEFGYVFDFGAGEEFAARRGAGATLTPGATFYPPIRGTKRCTGVEEGHPIRVAPQPGEQLEVVGVESAEPEWALPALEALAGQVYRLRVIGSIAITAAYVGAGRFDGMLSLRPCRSVDVAAAQLIVREAGGVVAFGDLALAEADLGLDARYPIAAAADERGLATIRAAQQA
ncbi:MAG TPA: inositol monophosphatase family protein [Solirubrobacterales bacterium]|nr:inositol monophosphatase family protein [Solirubrobacterales bacterium]